MKNKLWLLSLLALLLIGASYHDLVRLTVINKSGVDLGIRLENEDGVFYYLRVQEGDREHPVETVFTIERDKYQMTTYFVEPYDPVYGYTTCRGATISAELDATKNTKLVYPGCRLKTIKHRFRFQF